MRYIKAVSLIFFLLQYISPERYAFAEDAYLDTLLKSASERRLHEERYWEVLLHYKNKFFGTGSLIDDPKFFISTDGKSNPASELEATLRGFFSNSVSGDGHPRCRFIARYTWLKDRLNIDESKLPPAVCAEYEDAMRKINPKSVVLAFPASHINNPASMFGHTLLRIDSERDSRLLSYAVNYSAFTNETFGPFYAFRGVFGFYKGYFSIRPYYERVQEYSDLDQRDIWEYGLRLSEEEVKRMLMHLWELREMYSYYYFFDENCSYNLLFLLEAARPSLSLTDSGLVVIPTDTIRAVIENGLVEKVEYRPSKASKIRHIASALSGELQDKALAVAEGKTEPGSVLKEGIGPEEKIRVLDIAAEYIQSNYIKNKMEKEKYRELFLSVLRARGELGKAEDNLYDVPSPPAPEEGHPSRRLSLGPGLRDGEFFTELKYRPAYHDLTDPDEGQIEGLQIEFLDTALRYYPSDGELKLDTLDLINIASLAPRSRFYRSISWKILTGFSRRTFDDGTDHLIYRLNPGGGFSFKNSIGILYGLFETELDVGGKLEYDYAFGGGGSAGLVTGITSFWKLHLSARGIYYFLGDRDLPVRVSAAQRLKVNQKNSVVLEASAAEEHDVRIEEAKLSWNFFF